MLKQVSIYAENKKGCLQNITGILCDNGINILGSVTNDSAEYGIVRMVVSDPEKCSPRTWKAYRADDPSEARRTPKEAKPT